VKKPTINLFTKPEGETPYKPFIYPYAYELYKVHEVGMSWQADEIPMDSDIKDYKEVPEKDRHIIRSIFQGFTQSDVAVASGYDTLVRTIKVNEIKMMLRSFSNRESLHQDCYSLLLDTLGFPDEFYKEFKFIPSLNNKFEYLSIAKVEQFHKYLAMHQGDVKKAEDEFRKAIARMLAIYSGGVEGISLFSQFRILFQYTLAGKFKGMAKVVEYSVRDEEAHIEGNSWLFKQIIKENKHIWSDELKKDIYSAFRALVLMEEEYLEYVYSFMDLDEDALKESKQYVRYIADVRLKQFSLKPQFDVPKDPSPWFTEMLQNVTVTNFFDGRATEYSKGMTTGSWAEAQLKIKELFSQ